MDRRSLLRLLLPASLTAAAMPVATCTTRRILLQQSAVAGFQYHEGERLWPLLREGMALKLVREPDNRYDANAVAVQVRRYRIGYLPRAENTTISQLMDRGEKLSARIVSLLRDSDPWKRVGVAVELEV